MQKLKVLLCTLLLIGLSACSGGLGLDCFNDLDCPIGSICIEGICDGGESCVLDDECSDLAVCIDGQCVEAGQ